MKLNNLTKAELEAMSYDDIALMILTNENKKMKINELFKKVCDLLELSENEYLEKLPSFFDILSTDHRFIMVENGLWDLKEKHSTKIVIDNDDEDEELEEIEEDTDEDNEDEESKDLYADEDNDDLDENDDDLKDLVIIDEDEEANGMV